MKINTESINTHSAAAGIPSSCCSISVIWLCFYVHGLFAATDRCLCI